MDLVEMQALMLADEALSKGLPSALRPRGGKWGNGGMVQANTTYGMQRQNKNFYGRMAPRSSSRPDASGMRSVGESQAQAAKNSEARMAERGGKIGVANGSLKRMNTARDKRIGLQAVRRFEANRSPQWG